MPPASLYFIPFKENHSNNDRKMRAVLDQVGGSPVTLKENSECPHGASHPSYVAWWPPKE